MTIAQHLASDFEAKFNRMWNRKTGPPHRAAQIEVAHANGVLRLQWNRTGTQCWYFELGPSWAGERSIRDCAMTCGKNVMAGWRAEIEAMRECSEK